MNEKSHFFAAIGSAEFWANLVFAFSLLLVALFFLNPNLAWVLPETYVYKDHIVKLLHQDPHKLWFAWLDFNTFEFSPRTTRPLSSAFEIADTLARYYLWKLIPPLTSFSLTWLFTLLATPYLLFRLLIRLGFASPYALLGVAFYYVHPGTVSLYSMLFRPGKSVVEFFIVATAYVALLVSNTDRSVGRLGWLVRGFIFLSFLFDETGFVVVVIVTLLRPRVLFGSRKRFFATLMVPCVLGVVYSIVPVLSKWAGYPPQNLFKYEAFAGPRVVLSHYWENLLINYRLIFFESLAIFNPRNLPTQPLQLLFLLNILGICLLLSLSVYRYIKNRGQVRLDRIRRPAWGALVGILVLIPAHTFILNLVSDSVWGPYWYGAYFGIFFVIFLVSLADYADCFALSCPVFLLLILTSVYASGRTNLIYKKAHYYPYAPGNIQSMFLGNLNRFSSEHDYHYHPEKNVMRFWHQGRSASLNEKFPREAFWLPLELGWFVEHTPVTVGFVTNTEPGQPWFPVNAP